MSRFIYPGDESPGERRLENIIRWAFEDPEINELNDQLNEVLTRWGSNSQDKAFGRKSNNSYDNVLDSDEYRESATKTTIYPCGDEAGRENLEVPLQRSFTGPSYVLSSEDADTPLSDLGTQGILDRMNAILETDVENTPEMQGLLDFCLRTFADFGQAYSLLRPRWHMDPEDALEDVEMCREVDEKLRSQALVDDIIMLPHCPPRRLWDLRSNRVVPFWVISVSMANMSFDSSDSDSDDSDDDSDGKPSWFAVSHSWMDGTLRREVDSPINGHEWPVPIPIDTSLERIRIELLNLAAEAPAKLWPTGWQGSNTCYVWLDILCLRQEGVPSKEDVRQAEWRLDVPTIGPIYEEAVWTTYYFSGLGRPFTVSPGDKEHPRHWMNRAWTLQETRSKVVIAGRSSSSPDIPYFADLYSLADEWRLSNNPDDVVKTLMSTFTGCENVCDYLSLMRHRSATNELDKIAGLIFRLNKFRPPLPAYIVGENPEDAWNRLIKATDPEDRAYLFLLFPEPGNGKHVWCPTWQQIKDIDVLPAGNTQNSIDFDEDDNAYNIDCYRVEKCWVEGLSEVGSCTDPPRRNGKVLVVDERGTRHELPIAANHDVRIPDGYYDLVGNVVESSFGIIPNDKASSWVVARKSDQGFVKKVSVVQFEDKSTTRTMQNIAEGFGESTLRLL